ncbi:MAG: hypothetical protein FWE46_04735 [Coriobacteriia bacterium]|nr:hypothetical protein [Coriobacteriia bacterium]MCL2537615.1 hypothetical protein [Coriobacteriia bacterium]
MYKWGLIAVAVVLVWAHSPACASALSVTPEVNITKTLHVPEGLPTPDVSFYFEIVPWAFNDDVARVAKVPALHAPVVSFAAHDEAEAVAGVVAHVKDSDSLITGVVFPGPGYYTWRLSVAEARLVGGGPGGLPGPGVPPGMIEYVVVDPTVWQLTLTVEYVGGPMSGGPVQVTDAELCRVVDLVTGALGPKVEVEELGFLCAYALMEAPVDPPVDDPPGPPKPPDVEKPEEGVVVPGPGPGGGGGGGTRPGRGPRTADYGDPVVWVWVAMLALIVGTVCGLQLYYRDDEGAGGGGAGGVDWDLWKVPGVATLVDVLQLPALRSKS